MHSRQYGQRPGMVAPEAAALLTPKNEPAPAARAAGSRGQIEDQDSASGEGPTKAFIALGTELARLGYGLRRAPWGGFLITRWNPSRENAALDGVYRFLQGAAP